MFQGFAAITSERRCEELGGIQVSERSEELKKWHSGQLRELALLDEAWRASCGAGKSLPPAGRSMNELMPDVLSNVCEKDRLKVLAKAGLPSDSFARLADERAARTGALGACTKGDTGCRTLATAAVRQRNARDLKFWYEARRKRLVAIEAALSRDCPQVSAHDASEDHHVLSIPPILANLCAPDRAAVVAEAGIGLGDIDHQEQRIDAVQRAHLICAESSRAQSGCRTANDLRGRERDALLADLVAWHGELRAGALADEKALNAKRCPEARAPTSHADVVEPLRRHKICPAADASPIADAGLDEGAIRRLLAEREPTSTPACATALGAST